MTKVERLVCRAIRTCAGFCFVVVLVAGCSLPAIYSTDLQAVRSALARGEDPNQVIRNNLTPLQTITFLGVQKPGSLMPRAPDDPRYVPDSRRAQIARLLLDAGADPNKLFGYMHGPVSPLILASRNCLSETVRILLERGADPMLQLPVYGTALISVTKHCPKVVESQEIAEVLLDHVERAYGRVAMLEYADIRLPDNPLPALSLAVWFDRRGVVSAMLSRGVDIDRGGPSPAPGVLATGHGWTPLHVAAQMEREEILGALLLAGARTDLINDQGATAVAVNARYWREVSLGGALRAAIRGRQGLLGNVENAKEMVEIRSGLATRDYPDQLSWRSEPPPPGWNGLEEALKKRAALTAKPAGSTPSKTPGKPSAKPAYMTAPSAR